jgi:threonine/homoserine/homoserine lactone efflux protein
LPLSEPASAGEGRPEVIGLALASLLLGIAFCAPPGIVTAESVRRGLARGFWATLHVQLGSLVGDATWAVIALAGAAFLVQTPFVRTTLGLLGAAFLLHLAWSGVREGRRGKLPESRPGRPHGDFATGALLSLGNPWAIAFWLGAGASTITARVANPALIHFALFLAAFMAGALAWCFVLAALVAHGRQRLNARFFAAVNVCCALFLGAFGLQLLWNTLKALAG